MAFSPSLIQLGICLLLLILFDVMACRYHLEQEQPNDVDIDEPSHQRYDVTL